MSQGQQNNRYVCSTFIIEQVPQLRASRMLSTTGGWVLPPTPSTHLHHGSAWVFVYRERWNLSLGPKVGAQFKLFSGPHKLKIFPTPNLKKKNAQEQVKICQVELICWCVQFFIVAQYVYSCSLN